jgi:hypothetical protein
VRFPCATAHIGAEQARCGTVTRRLAQGWRAGWPDQGLGVAGGRQQMAAPVKSYGVQAVIGTVAALIEDGLRDLILATVGQQSC